MAIQAQMFNNKPYFKLYVELNDSSNQYVYKYLRLSSSNYKKRLLKEIWEQIGARLPKKFVTVDYRAYKTENKYNENITICNDSSLIEEAIWLGFIYNIRLEKDTSESYNRKINLTFDYSLHRTLTEDKDYSGYVSANLDSMSEFDFLQNLSEKITEPVLTNLPQALAIDEAKYGYAILLRINDSYSGGPAVRNKHYSVIRLYSSPSITSWKSKDYKIGDKDLNKNNKSISFGIQYINSIGLSVGVESSVDQILYSKPAGLIKTKSSIHTPDESVASYSIMGSIGYHYLLFSGRLQLSGDLFFGQSNYKTLTQYPYLHIRGYYTSSESFAQGVKLTYIPFSSVRTAIFGSIKWSEEKLELKKIKQKGYSTTDDQIVIERNPVFNKTQISAGLAFDIKL